VQPPDFFIRAKLFSRKNLTPKGRFFAIRERSGFSCNVTVSLRNRSAQPQKKPLRQAPPAQANLI
jgi:hypothetical protein